MRKKQEISFAASLRESQFEKSIVEAYRTIERLKGSQDRTDKLERKIAEAEIRAYYDAYKEVYPEPQSYETAIETIKMLAKGNL